jgi:hypothetical protein
LKNRSAFSPHRFYLEPGVLIGFKKVGLLFRADYGKIIRLIFTRGTMPHGNQSQEARQKGAEPVNALLAKDMLAQAPKGEDTLTSRLRAEAKSALEKGAVAPPPVDPDKPGSDGGRGELVYGLGLRGQYEARADNIVELIARGVFAEGAPMPTCEAVLKTFSTEQLEIASKYQEPKLLIVPETSFAAKVAALDAAMAIAKERSALSIRHEGPVSKADRERVAEIGKWQNAYVNHETFLETDPGSERITGWRAVIVDGANEIDPAKMGDDVKLALGGRRDRRKEARRPGEGGMDRHLYAMLMLDAVMKGEPVDKVANDWRYTLLEDDSANSESRVPYAGLYPDVRRVRFGWSPPGDVDGYGRFRRSVGGDVPKS